MSQLTWYLCVARSSLMLAGPKTGVLPAQSAAPCRGSPVSSHTSTTGARLPLNLPASKFAPPLGSGTSGGKKKKSALPLVAPSMMSADGPHAAVGFRICSSRHPMERTAVKAATRRDARRMVAAFPRGDQKNKIGHVGFPLSRFRDLLPEAWAIHDFSPRGS